MAEGESSELKSMGRPPKRARLEYASQCALPTTWVSLPLMARRPVNHDTHIFDFGVPDGFEAIQLPTCACLLLCADNAEHGGGDAIRPYTPISPEDMKGRFQLLVKVYQQWGDPLYAHSFRPAGAASNFINRLQIGECIKFKHIPQNIKIQYPFVGVNTITMIAVGAGIAPMIQALHKLLQGGDTTKIVLLYGNRTVSDILLKEKLDEWAEKHHDRFRFIPVIGSRWSTNVRIGLKQPALPAGFEELAHPRCVKLAQELQSRLWVCTSSEERERVQEEHIAQHGEELSQLKPVAELGWVNYHVIKKHAYRPAQDTRVFVCGLPEVYKSLCGPRTDADLDPNTILAKLGYTETMVVKF